MRQLLWTRWQEGRFWVNSEKGGVVSLLQTQGSKERNGFFVLVLVSWRYSSPSLRWDITPSLITHPTPSPAHFALINRRYPYIHLGIERHFRVKYQRILKEQNIAQSIQYNDTSHGLNPDCSLRSLRLKSLVIGNLPLWVSDDYQQFVWATQENAIDDKYLPYVTFFSWWIFLIPFSA